MISVLLNGSQRVYRPGVSVYTCNPWAEVLYGKDLFLFMFGLLGLLPPKINTFTNHQTENEFFWLLPVEWERVSVSGGVLFNHKGHKVLHKVPQSERVPEAQGAT